eukprot:GFUD01076063.1.p1 GENE.GFUD01076063.1~~GFUD01076063.1.p1  ORF type:complete len:145 (+),score=24.73 GFUD01076063.1:87-521(+)
MRIKIKPRENVESFKLFCHPPKKSKPENTNLLQLSVSKLAKLKNPQTKLCKAVLINNAFKNLQTQFQSGLEGLIGQGSLLSKDHEQSRNEKDTQIVESSRPLCSVQTEEDILHQTIPLSPYSYNSFLSEVYWAVSRNINRKIES